MFEHVPAIDQAIDRLMHAAKDLTRGDILTWPRIESVSGMRRYKRHWSCLIFKLKRRFEQERGIELWAVTDVGMRLSTVEDQLFVNPKKRLRKAARQAMRSKKSLQALPPEELNEQERAERNDRINILRRAERSNRRSEAALRALTVPCDPLPM
jgi:hypothetical protein